MVDALPPEVVAALGATTDEIPLADTAAPPEPEPAEVDADDPLPDVLPEATPEAAESVAVAEGLATVETPLTLGPPPPAAALDVDPFASAVEVVEVDEDPDESDESEEPDEELEPLAEPLFAAPFVIVHVLTCRTAGLPLTSVIGVSVITQVCVISPATVVVVV